MEIRGFKSYDQFLLEKDSSKIIPKESTEFDKKVGFIKLSHDMSALDGGTTGRQLWMNQAALNKLYLTYSTLEDLDKDIKVPTDIPMLNYGGHSKQETKDFIKKHKIPTENLYNKGEFTKLSGSKVEFAKIFKGKDWLPKTVFNRDEAINGQVGFPVIAKIEDGHSGLGIKKFDTKEDLEKEPKTFTLRGDERTFDLYSQFINFDREYRCIFIDGKCVIVNERVDNIKEDKSIRTKKLNQKLKFIYVEQDFDKIPKEWLEKVNKIAKEISKEIPLEAWSLDIIVDKEGKIWVCEINSATGLGSGKLCKYYMTIYENFYKKQLPQEFKDELFTNFISQGYIQFWPEKKKEIESSPWAIDYAKIAKDYPEIPDQWYKDRLEGSKN